LKPKCDEALSNFAFKFNLRRYNAVTPAVYYAAADAKPSHSASPFNDLVDKGVIILEKPEMGAVAAAGGAGRGGAGGGGRVGRRAWPILLATSSTHIL